MKQETFFLTYKYKTIYKINIYIHTKGVPKKGGVRVVKEQVKAQAQI
jgi:hypothetical protein